MALPMWTANNPTSLEKEQDMKKVYVLMFGGLADWEAPLALCEIRNSGK